MTLYNDKRVNPTDFSMLLFENCGKMLKKKDPRNIENDNNNKTIETHHIQLQQKTRTGKSTV